MSVSKIINNLREYKNNLNEKLTGKLKGFSISNLTDPTKTVASKINETSRKVQNTIIDGVDFIGESVLKTVGIMEAEYLKKEKQMIELKNLRKKGKTEEADTNVDQIINHNKSEFQKRAKMMHREIGNIPFNAISYFGNAFRETVGIIGNKAMKGVEDIGEALWRFEEKV